jgi:hypothetical protein
MKKFITNMLLAIIVYVLVYVAILGYLRINAAQVRQYCELLETGMTLAAMESLAHEKGLETALTPVAEDDKKILFVSDKDISQAVCKGLIEGGVLTSKKFELSVF